jgi:hypothetical protein
MLLALLTNNYYFGQPDSTNWWAVVPSIAAAVIAAVALILNSIATRAQTLESIFRDVRDVETEYMLNYAKAGTDEQNITDEQKIWNAKFFNTIEHLCFHLNRKLLRDERLYKFFEPSTPTGTKNFS